MFAEVGTDRKVIVYMMNDRKNMVVKTNHTIRQHKDQSKQTDFKVKSTNRYILGEELLITYCSLY